MCHCMVTDQLASVYRGLSEGIDKALTTVQAAGQRGFRFVRLLNTRSEVCRPS